MNLNRVILAGVLGPFKEFSKAGVESSLTVLNKRRIDGKLEEVAETYPFSAFGDVAKVCKANVGQAAIVEGKLGAQTSDKNGKSYTFLKFVAFDVQVAQLPDVERGAPDDFDSDEIPF